MCPATSHVSERTLIDLSCSPSNPYVFSLFSKPLLTLSASLYIQTGIKWLLTEGDKLLVSAFATLEDQGMYAISANYGGLIARMLFRPIEDSSRNLFAKLCAPPSTPHPSSKTNSKPPTPAQQPPNIHRAAEILRTILRLYTIFSLLTFTLGPTLAPLLLNLIAGPRWTASGAADVLATYCYCIPLLALNGVSEAFVSATASTTQLQTQSLWMAGFSAGFALSAYVFLRVLEMGAKGLVLANCVNMGLRIMFNLRFAVAFFEGYGVGFGVAELLPSVWAVGASAVVPSVLARTEGLVPVGYGLFGELGRVGVVGGMFALVV